MDRPLIALDTETATLAGAPHLIELGAVRAQGGEITDHFESLARPEVAIEPEATDIHGLGDADVRDAPPTAEVLRAFAEWVGDDWGFAHNAAFDARVLGFEFARAGLAPPDAPLFDSLPLARKALPDADDHKLVTLAELLELEPSTHHRALADAVTCWMVVATCAERLGAASAAELVSKAGRPRTIAGEGPRDPRRLPRRLRPLLRAQEDGASVEVLYGTGPAPARLELIPRLLFQGRERGYLEAEDSSSGTLRTFRIDRIQRVLC